MDISDLTIDGIDTKVLLEGNKINLYKKNKDSFWGDDLIRIGNINKFNGEYFFNKSYHINNISHSLIKELNIIMDYLESNNVAYK